jgi:hypothetical protein
MKKNGRLRARLERVGAWWLVECIEVLRSAQDDGKDKGNGNGNGKCKCNGKYNGVLVRWLKAAIGR